jgi:glycosyltransferase involved in cell wall biosynthesis
MFISVVIPAYNEERYLGQCLEALRTQTYPAEQFELIVVDNGSSDATALIAQCHGARVVWEPMRGIGQARQSGVLAARGEIIAGTDADTIVPPHWLSHIAWRFAADPALGGLYGPVRYMDGKSLDKLADHTINASMWLTAAVRRPCFSGNNWAARREAIWQAGGFNSALLAGEDLDFSMRLYRVTRVDFDPQLAAHTSARRMREGYGRIIARTARSTVRFVFMGQTPLPLPPVR